MKEKNLKTQRITRTYTNRNIRKINFRFFTVLTIFTMLFYGIIANVCNSKVEAATTKDVYDVILFYGQSNMVGSAFSTPETRHVGREVQFGGETNTDLSIIKKIRNCSSIDLDLPSGIAYEYLYYKENSFNERNEIREIKQKSNGKWTTGEYLKWNGTGINKVSDADAFAGVQNADTHKSDGTNMIPQFCKTYNQLTGHKVLAVVCAKGSQPISECTSNGNIGKVMNEKYKAAVQYAQARSDWKVENYFAVAIQGEMDVELVRINQQTVEGYKQSYADIKAMLCDVRGISKIAIVETGYEVPYTLERYRTYTTSMANVNVIYNAQEQLIAENPQIILGSNYLYNSFVPDTKEDYDANCFTNVAYTYDGEVRNGKTYAFRELKVPYGEAMAKALERVDIGASPITGEKNNVIHFTSASLSQVGMEVATNLAKCVGEVNLKLLDNNTEVTSGMTSYWMSKRLTISRTATEGRLSVESGDPSIAAVFLNGNTLTIIPRKRGTVNIWVASHGTEKYKTEVKMYTLTIY